MPEQRILASRAASQLLVTNPLFHTSQSIACYLAQTDELDCMAIIQKVWQSGKTCYLPVLSTQKKQSLEFVAYQLDDPLQLNRYNIFEPIQGHRLAADKLDLVIVPLVAFDRQQHRVGMGGGYYDRTFAFKNEGVTDQPFLLGLGYEFQKIEAVPNDFWDVMLDGVLTEKQVYLLNSD